MTRDVRNTREPVLTIRQQWQQFADFQGSPTEFWALFAQHVAQSVGGDLSVLYFLASGEGEAEVWQPLAFWPQVAADRLPTLKDSAGVDLLFAARSEGVAFGPAANGSWQIGLIAMSTDAGQHEVILAVHLNLSRLSESNIRQRLAIFQSLPQLYEIGRGLKVSERDTVRLVQALEILGRVLECESFDQACLVTANEFAERYGCETVSLSWRAREGLRLRSISHAEKLERRSELTALLEEAGQEAISQGCEIVWPGAGKAVTRAHKQYAELQGPGHLLTLPLQNGQKPLGAITLERQKMAFSSAEQWALRMMCDMLMSPLSILESRSRSLIRRLGDEIWRSVPTKLKSITEDGHKFVRAIGIAVILVMLMPIPYAVDATAIVKTDVMAFVGAPFDGYLEASQSSLGVTVRTGDVLFTLTTRELALERAGILADIAQSLREAEKRRASNQLPEMLIAEAQVSQARARLKQIEYRLENAQSKSPIDGVVVEGEPGKNLGGAVRRGDVVVKVAALSNLYIEAAVPERDISRIAMGQDVRVRLLADTGMTHQMRVTRIVPSASVKEGSNTFPVRVQFAKLAPDWWRPGMSGVVKIDVGYRPVIWIISHRLVDFLRLALWF